MTTAKQPQDRKTPAKKKPASQTKKPDTKPDTWVVEVDGVTVTVPHEAFDDFDVQMEFDEILQAGEEGRNPRPISARTFKKILGDAYPHARELANTDGRVSNARMHQFIIDVFRAVGEQAGIV